MVPVGGLRRVSRGTVMTATGGASPERPDCGHLFHSQCGKKGGGPRGEIGSPGLAPLPALPHLLQLSPHVSCRKTSEGGTGLVPGGVGLLPWLPDGVFPEFRPCTNSPCPIQAASLVPVLECCWTTPSTLDEIDPVSTSPQQRELGACFFRAPSCTAQPALLGQ